METNKQNTTKCYVYVCPFFAPNGWPLKASVGVAFKVDQGLVTQRSSNDAAFHGGGVISRLQAAQAGTWRAATPPSKRQRHAAATRRAVFVCFEPPQNCNEQIYMLAV